MAVVEDTDTTGAGGGTIEIEEVVEEAEDTAISPTTTALGVLDMGVATDLGQVTPTKIPKR